MANCAEGLTPGWCRSQIRDYGGDDAVGGRLRSGIAICLHRDRDETEDGNQTKGSDS